MDRELSFRNEGQWFESRPSMMVSREFEGALKTLSRSQARQPWWLVMPIHKNVYVIASKQFLQKAPTSVSKPVHTGVSARKSIYESTRERQVRKKTVPIVTVEIEFVGFADNLERVLSDDDDGPRPAKLHLKSWAIPAQRLHHVGPGGKSGRNL